MDSFSIGEVTDGLCSFVACGGISGVGFLLGDFWCCASGDWEGSEESEMCVGGESSDNERPIGGLCDADGVAAISDLI